MERRTRLVGVCRKLRPPRSQCIAQCTLLLFGGGIGGEVYEGKGDVDVVQTHSGRGRDVELHTSRHCAARTGAKTRNAAGRPNLRPMHQLRQQRRVSLRSRWEKRERGGERGLPILPLPLKIPKGDDICHSGNRVEPKLVLIIGRVEYGQPIERHGQVALLEL